MRFPASRMEHPGSFFLFRAIGEGQMAKRSRELFELLHNRPKTDRRTERTTERKAASRPTVQPVSPAPDREATRSTLWSRATRKLKSVNGRIRAGRGGPGGRRIDVSLNVLLFLIGSMVVVSVGSYLVGRTMGDRKEVSLATEVQQFWAAQVTPPFPSELSFEAWRLRDQLIDAGFENAEVVGLKKGTSLQVIAGKFERKDEEACWRMVNDLKVAIAKLLESGSLENRMPIDIGKVVVYYRNREPVEVR